MTPLPAVFISHGAPTLPLEDAPAGDFLKRLGQELARPRAVVAVSAHWEAKVPTVGSVARPETIHDFYGFPDELYQLAYPAPGDPALAARVGELMDAAGIEARTNERRGLDHGAWVPLMMMYPEADVPVVQLSVQSRLGPRHHLMLGRALDPLREEGVLVLASGNATHNLAELERDLERDEPLAYVEAFDDWLIAAVTEGRTEDLLDYRQQAPEAARAHPSEEHLLPLFVALAASGANGAAVPGRLLHRSYRYRALAMTAFAFGEE